MAGNTSVLSALSPGNGMAAYMQISKEYLENSNGIEGDFINIKLAELSDIMYDTNRKVSAFWSSGNRNARGLNKGVRLSSGKMVIQVIDADFIAKIQQTMIITDDNGAQTTNALKKYYSFGTMKPINTKDSENTINKDVNSIKYADEIPLCDIIVVAKGDHEYFQGETRVFKPETVVQLKLKGVKFLTDIFSVAAGSRIADKVADILILKGIEDWKEI